jgi:hypothetical protein
MDYRGWTYACAGQRGSKRGIVIKVSSGPTPVRQVRRYGMRRAYEGETIFESGFSNYTVRINVLSKATPACRWSVWAIEGKA